MSQTIDQRPPVAVGHVWLPATDVAAAERWLESVGLRPIFAGDDLAVLELRGGTHVFVGSLGPSDISRGRIHDSFHLAGPDGYDFTVTSSHAGGRIV